MNNRLLLTIFATTFLLLGSFSAKAGLIVVDGATGGSIPGGATNDLLEDVYGAGTTDRDGYYGATLKFASTSGEFAFDVEFLGKEASFINTFVLDGSTIFSTDTAVAGTEVGSFVLEASDFLNQVIPFLFTYNSGSGSVVNGSNPDDAGGTVDQNFFVSCVDNATATSCDSIDIFLDDGGAGPDDNHDDIAIRLTARVPEPGTLVLLGLSLIGLGLVRRKA